MFELRVVVFIIPAVSSFFYVFLEQIANRANESEIPLLDLLGLPYEINTSSLGQIKNRTERRNSTTTNSPI